MIMSIISGTKRFLELAGKEKHMNKKTLLLALYREKLWAKFRSKIWKNIHMSLQQANLRSNLRKKTNQIVRRKYMIIVNLLLI